MIPVMLSELASVLAGEQFGHDVAIQQVVIDSRLAHSNGLGSQFSAGTLFVALQGARFDGHQFAEAAWQAGAQALLISKRLPIAIPQVVVNDSGVALYGLARWLRRQVDVQAVAVTGSSGKTTVKEMTAAILKQCGATLSTFKNHNNHTVGVPLTLLQLTPAHRFLVVEVAANAAGEIAHSSAAVRPEAVLINNVSAAHLEGFGSLAGVAQAKGEILISLAAGGRAIINLDSHALPQWQAHLTTQQVWRFSLQADKGADFYPTQIVQTALGQCHFLLHTPFGTTTIALQLLGRHNMANAVAAAALAMAVGAELSAVRQGLAQLTPIPGRLCPQQLAPGQYLIDDTYNANVASMLAAVQLLQQLPGYRILVVGDMAELGTLTEACHRQVALALQATTIDAVLSVGHWSALLTQLPGGQHFSHQAALITALLKRVKRHSALTILVKGSRSAAMERVVEALQQAVLSTAAAC